jgi:hypothetical protein
MVDYEADVRAIEALVETLFASLCWTAESPPDWDRFRAQVKPEALLLPSARPVSPTALEPFIAMMKGQRDSGALHTFEESVTKHKILVFGNIAVALSAYNQQINGGDVGQGVNGFLLIRESDGWKIGAMCWDSASADHPVPDDLGGHG